MPARSIVRERTGLMLLMTLVVLGAAPCGAEDVDAPPDPPEPVAVCPGPSALAPALYRMLTHDAFAGLRTVIEDVLSLCTDGLEPLDCADPRAAPPPAAVLLGGLTHAVGAFGSDPPEVDPTAAPGDPGYCAAGDAAPTPPNRMCTLRRAVDRLVLERTGEGRIILVQAFDDLQPLLATFLRYIDGGLPGFPEDGYDLVPLAQRMVERCDDQAVLDLLAGLMVWLEPPHGQEAFEAALRLLRNPDAQAFLQDLDVKNEVGREGFIALGRVVLDAIAAEGFQPSDLEVLFEDLIYPAVRQSYPDHGLETDLRGGVAVLMALLDPAREPGVLRPLQRVVGCYQASDPGGQMIGAAFDLVFASEAIGLEALLTTLIALTEVDPDGRVLAAGRLLLAAFAADPETRAATRVVLREVLSAEHTRLIVPVLVEVFDNRILSEVVVLADVLLRGCGEASP